MRIDKNEVTRYLGHKGQSMPDDMLSLIDECIEQCVSLSRPKYTHSLFDVFQNSYDKITFFKSEIIFPGKSLAKHVKGAAACVFLAATLGIDVDNHINLLQRVDLTRAVIFDACASAAIESVCDDAQAEIETMLKAGQKLNRRFSPGYGDFPLDVQLELLKCVNAEKTIGLYCNQNNLLIPRKSVTAVIGVFDGQSPPSADLTKCERCAMANTCAYRKDKLTCDD